MTYADYAFYTGVYCGNTVPAECWGGVALHADSAVDAVTFGRLHQGEQVPDAARLASCAVADVLYTHTQAAAQRTGGLLSEDVDGLRVTYEGTQATLLTKQKAVRDAVDTFLPRSHPLRYAGV